MKKIIFNVTLILATVLISGYTQPSQNERTNKSPQTTIPKNTTGTIKAGQAETRTAREVFNQSKTTLGRERILFLINNGSVLGIKSPALWWNYQPGQAGC
jgi:hypothetical protein